MASFSQLVDSLQIQLSQFSVCEVRAGSGLPLVDSSAALHYVIKGTCAVRRRGRADVRLAPNTVIIQPAGIRLSIECATEDTPAFPEPRCKPIPGGWDWIEVGDGEAGVVLACARLEVTHQGASPLFDHLDEPIIEDMSGDAGFRDAMDLLLKELAWPKPGTPALASILMKQCLIHLLRRTWDADEGRVPWLQVLQHPQLGEALAAMGLHPERAHTLQTLAEAAGMSRSAFADRFKATFDRSAMDYLREVRMRRAVQLLETSDLPIKAIASRVGFESRSHFTRAFKGVLGVHPRAYREGQRDETQQDSEDASPRPARARP